ncbi:hypothetical protein ACRAWD_19400 [Caulobacter segnis]
MAARNVTVDDVENALNAQNLELPAGLLESASKDFTIRVVRSYAKPEDFARLLAARGRRQRLRPSAWATWPASRRASTSVVASSARAMASTRSASA